MSGGGGVVATTGTQTTNSGFTPTVYTNGWLTTGAGATSTTGTIPLTTVFTAPSSCNDATRFTQSLWAGNTIAYVTNGFRSQCYPTQYTSWLTEYLAYSPGVCPALWNYVATTTTSGSSGAAPTTFAVCCPPNFSTGGSPDQNCFQSVTSSWSGLPSWTTNNGPILAYEHAVTIAWQSSDLPHFTPASAPIVALDAQLAGAEVTSLPVISSILSYSSSPAISLSSTPSASARQTSPITSTITVSSISHSATPSSSSSTSSTSPHATSLSTGAVAGIAVAATLLGVALLALLAFLIFRRYRFIRREPRGATSSSAPDEKNTGTPLTGTAPGGATGGYGSAAIAEKSGANIVEAEATDQARYEVEHPPAEADYGHARYELEAPSGVIEVSGSRKY